MSSVLRTLDLILILILGTGAEQEPPRELTQGHLVVLYWLGAGGSKREITAANQVLCPDQGILSVSVSGRELLLEIERNDQLIGSGYVETHYKEDGTRVTITPNYTKHCLYQGHVKGHEESSVALSLCSGVSGIVVVDTTNSYYVQPIRDNNSQHHIIHRTEHLPMRTTEHLPMRTGTCGHGDDNQSGISVINQFVHQNLRVRRDSWDNVKYVELYMVADNAEFQSQLSDLGKTKERILEIANYVDKFYRPMNIRIALIGLEVWTHSDQIRMSEDPNTALWAFLKWRQELWGRVKHDNVQLITGIKFKGTTIGMAPLEGMCVQDTSGGVTMVRQSPAVGWSPHLIHFPERRSIIVIDMQASHPFPRVFSSCSQAKLRNYFQKGGGMCLYNRPDMSKLYGAHRCGNGYVEDLEECDCGDEEECVNPCCNANNCTLKAGAQCAHGVCCKNCKLRPAGTVCRNAAGSCDLPEYCTGASPYCPFNVYRLDGLSCDNGRAYCYTGMCLSHQQQCEQLWGSGARAAPTACFEDVNAAGNDYGNCGKNSEGTFLKCESSDAMCGKIQCQTSAKNPKERNTVSIDTTIRFDGRDVKCRGTYLYSTVNGQEDLPDPGLVKTGTKCGYGKVRVECDKIMQHHCENKQQWEEADDEKDVIALERVRRRFTGIETYKIGAGIGHSALVCNSNRNCHCDSHWAPPHCDKPGLGGSIDSGPVHRDNQQALLIALLFTFLLLIPAIFISLFCCYKHREALCKQWKDFRGKRAKVDRTEAIRKQNLRKPNFQMEELLVGEVRWREVSGRPLVKPKHPVGSRPVNFVRPLSVPKHNAGNPKPPRPAPPKFRKSQIVSVKLENQPKKLGIPGKMLPLNTQTPLTPAASMPVRKH
ncbi:disintegrin and metalloproteinase domain-containing protein 19-like [Heterodontus francisci]|uniref:disintegrin and metalloproteinase domain-containing protein 19-like n=1 Tax=Heterodontus francisci TaxID=7792 RepID=UPI00355B3A57